MLLKNVLICPQNRLKIFLLLYFYLTKVLQFLFLRRDAEKCAINKQHKLCHLNSGWEKFGSADRHAKKKNKK